MSAATLDVALKAVAHQEKVIGSLEVGKWADFIVTDGDLFKAPVTNIGKIGVLQTWVAGTQVYVKP